MTLRHVKTFREIRAVAATEVEGVAVRAKRSRRALPTLWADQERSVERCWKAFRKNQYRA